VALNNLAYALTKQRDIDEARATYNKVLALDPANTTARKGLRTLERRVGNMPVSTAESASDDDDDQPGGDGGKGFSKAA